MSGMLDELNKGLDDLSKANLPEYDRRLRNLEIKVRDLETRLKPLLEIIRVK
jgi:hypothetical protein